VDGAVAAGGVLFAVGVTAVSVAAGSWRFLTGI
jgi:hypothetical protein